MTRFRQTPILFCALFAAQASFLALVSTLPHAADEFGVSTAMTGQLATVAGVSGVCVALAIALRGGSAGARQILIAGLLALAVGCGLALASGSLAAIATAQLLVGGAAAAVASAGTAAAFIWPAPEQRAQTIAWVLLGQPAAWIVGSPFVGALAERDWRLVWAVPLVAALLVLLAIARAGLPRASGVEPGFASLMARASVRRWAGRELLAYTGWNGALIYSGALFIEVHGLSAVAVGLLLSGAASAYFPGALIARRFAEVHAERLLLWLALLAAPAALVLGAAPDSAAVGVAALAAVAALNGGRVLAGSVRGQQLAPDRPLSVAAARIAIAQCAGLLGGLLGGIALALGQWPAFGALLALLFMGSAAVGAADSLQTRFGRPASTIGNPADVTA